MPAKILPFPARYYPAVPPPAMPERPLPAWLRDRPCPLDRVEVALLRLDWAVRDRRLRQRPTG